ncbi:RHS repeat domain-containing protein [Sorangium sp. So ce363]|uniref:RHS repeat domain-containing protein n=1 Tax=Sorangium sp. So ce363 TaxID=3133304 RepID=UPI003F5D5C1E
MRIAPGCERVGASGGQEVYVRLDRTAARPHETREITDSVGRIVRVRRAPDGRIGAFESKNARERGVWVPFAQYSYDAAGDLTSATDAEGYTTRYTYQEHLLTSHTSPTGLTFSFRYDDWHRCVET